MNLILTGEKHKTAANEVKYCQILLNIIFCEEVQQFSSSYYDQILFNIFIFVFHFAIYQIDKSGIWLLSRGFPVLPLPLICCLCIFCKFLKKP